MVSHRIVSGLLLVLLSFVSASTSYEGYGTVYTLSSPSDGNCNFMNWPSDAVTKYAALNAEQWEETMNCGRCAEVTCTDSSCAGQSSEIVYIMDQCPGCEYGDLDLSPDVFESITGQSYTKLSIEWKFVDCPISNNVQYCLKTGSSEFWVAVQPANFVSGVQSLSINGQETSVIDSAYYFLIDGSGESVADLSSISISLTGVNGEVIEETMSLTADECTEGSKQFSSSGDTSQTTTIAKPSATTSSPTSAASSTPTPSTAPPTTTPTPIPAAPTSAPITEAPATEIPTSAPVTEAPTAPPVTQAPTTAPVTEAPTTTPVTEAPTTALVTTAPPTEVPTTVIGTEIPTSKPIATTPTATLTRTSTIPVTQSASASSDASRSSSAWVDQDIIVVTKSATGSTNSTSSSTDQETVSSVSSEELTTSTTQVSSSTTVEATSAPFTPTPAATEASVQEASNSGGLHSTGAIIGLIAAVCVALGAVVGVTMVVHKKRKMLEERKNLEDRDSLASYVSIRTPRSEVPVMHSAV